MKSHFLLLVMISASLFGGTVDITVPNSNIVLKVWAQTATDGSTEHFYSISNTNGKMITPMAKPVRTAYDIKLRHNQFDPLTRVPEVATAFQAGEENGVYIVQFHTQTLNVFREQMEAMGARVQFFLANHSHLVVMNQDVRNRVEQLPYVRWIGAYHPAYRLEAFLLDQAESAETVYPKLTYNLMLFHSDKEIKNAVAGKITKLGGTVNRANAGKYLMEVTLTPTQLFEIITWNEVLFVDRWSPIEKDMDLAREYGGANFIETIEGFTGDGVRGEVFDAGFNVTHVDFGGNLMEHTPMSSDSHGAATSGIVFGDGTGNPDARGLLPDAQGIVAVYTNVFTGQARYDHTAELVQSPYYAVFQTSSVGSNRTLDYTTISADTDAMLFDFDIVHCQSQSNAGDQMSRPQAWAKNIISGGGVKHMGTLDPSDDAWTNGGSIGPATDGRIKPDLCAYYDGILTTTTGSTTAYTTSFGGTSGATPIIAGYVGLFFDMWSDGIFENTVIPSGTVFDNRSHMTTAKAMMINTARPYDFTGQSHDLTRVHQGWGFPDVKKMYEQREKFVIIDETEILSNMETALFTMAVLSGEPEFKVTLVYADPAGVPSSSQHRINDLTLKVTSPDNVVYWGNNGLLDGNWSTPGGDANHVDTVENVWIQNPIEGAWVVEVIAEEINQDSHVETPQVDADFALVAQGAELGAGFILSTDISSIDACSGGPVDVDVNIIDFLGYSETVTFSVENAPAGLATSFSVPSVVPPGQAVLTLSDFANVTPGHYLIDVVGTAIDMVRRKKINLYVSHIIPPKVQAVSPANGSIDTSLYPEITWSQADQASSYHFQLASDAAFSTILAEETLTGTTYTVMQRLNTLSRHYWRVMASNGCGDNGYSSTFSFTTSDQPDYMTEDYTSSPNDLATKTITATPDGSGDFYMFCGYDDVLSLPTDPSGGTVHALSDDSNVEVSFTTPVLLYGQSYNSLFISSNGYVTFNSGSTDYTPTLAEHFALPRVACLYDDLNPSSAGTITSQELADRFVVTFQDVPEFSTSNKNTFQIEFFHNGEIHVTWLQIDSGNGLAGLSAGLGLPGDFISTDISEKVGCDVVVLPPCPGNYDENETVNAADYQLLRVGWRTLGPQFDLNDDGISNLIDLLLHKSFYGDCPTAP